MKSLFYLIVFLCCTSVRAQQVSCYHLHNGRFKIIDSVHNSIILIERKDSAEVQYLYKNGDTTQYDMKLIFKVDWLNDCTYNEYLVENLIHTKKGDKHLPTDKRVITNRIMETDNFSYLVFTEFSKNKVRYSNRVWKIQ